MDVLVIKKGFSTLRSRNSTLRYQLMCSPIDIIQEWSKQHIPNFLKMETTQTPTRPQGINTSSFSHTVAYDTAANVNRPQLNSTRWISHRDTELGDQKHKRHPLWNSTCKIFKNEQNESMRLEVRRKVTSRCVRGSRWRLSEEGCVMLSSLIIRKLVTWVHPANERSSSCGCDLHMFLYLYFNRRFLKERVVSIPWMTTTLYEGLSQPRQTLMFFPPHFHSGHLPNFQSPTPPSLPIKTIFLLPDPAPQHHLRGTASASRTRCEFRLPKPQGAFTAISQITTWRSPEPSIAHCLPDDRLSVQVFYCSNNLYLLTS